MKMILAVLAVAGALHAVPARADMARDVLASWYDCRAKGQCSKSKITASGEKFKPNGLTAAHRTLPLGTRLRVCHRGRCVVCRVNDRGPAGWTGRSLDLAAGTARAIGMTGVARVTMQRI